MSLDNIGKDDNIDEEALNQDENAHKYPEKTVQTFNGGDIGLRRVFAGQGIQRFKI
ncbi:hypothetical protein glysoja_033535 [Glycine soja]|uniref:Uncharacterized protein n=1 Tax=Glycine soja TaxID=3848 RepID=A0A0B2QJ15_GLYSO|nr:hypothetical protein glysoja_033535 [Glycine soja]